MDLRQGFNLPQSTKSWYIICAASPGHPVIWANSREDDQMSAFLARLLVTQHVCKETPQRCTLPEFLISV